MNGKKNKRSTVYFYLLILFGAAFLMLLLAYFVQQRSSETTISDLRDSMNLSREELMDEIENLEGQIKDLRDQQTELNKQLTDARQMAAGYEALYDSRTNDEMRELKRADALANLWTTDYLYRTGQYEDCAESLINFNDEVMHILPPEALFEE